jgi:hypothetical protein
MTDKQILIVKQLKNLVQERYNIETLTKKVSEIFNEDIKIEDITSGKHDCDLSDYNLLFESKNDDTYGFFDIFFLKTRKTGYNGETMYITEISFEFE